MILEPHRFSTSGFYLQDPRSTRTILIGLGFRERETAFDFKTALNEYVKYIDRMALADKLSSLDRVTGDNNTAGDGDDDEDRARLQDHRSKQSAVCDSRL